MSSSLRAARAALALVGTSMFLGLGATAGAQRHPRGGGAPEPRPQRPPATMSPAVPSARTPGSPYPGPGEWRDPRFPQVDPRYAQPDPRYVQRDRQGGRQEPRYPNRGGSTIIYVPVPGGYGYDYSRTGYGYGYGGPSVVYDVNGRPLSSGYEAQASSGGFSYTPDLSGTPYDVTDEGMMVVDVAGGRRAFPSCAGRTDSRDPNGRPRTIFYQPTDYWMVLHPGQRGRVQGEVPSTGVQACYAIDTTGRVVLRY